VIGNIKNFNFPVTRCQDSANAFRAALKTKVVATLAGLSSLASKVQNNAARFIASLDKKPAAAPKEINEYFFRPLDLFNKERFYVDVVAKAVAAIVLTLVFSLLIGVIVKTGSLASRGVSILLLFPVADHIYLNVRSLAEDVRFFVTRKKNFEEELFEKLQPLNETALKEHFFKLTAHDFDAYFEKETLNCLNKEKPKKAPIFHFIPIMVRYESSKKKLEDKIEELASKVALLPLYTIPQQDKGIHIANYKPLYEIAKLRIEMAFNFAVLLFPARIHQSSLENIGHYIDGAYTGEKDLRESELPLFVSNHISIDEGPYFKSNDDYISFHEAFYHSTFVNASKLANVDKLKDLD